MLFAQAETTLNAFDRYGIAVGMLVLFVIATAWIGRRLLNEKNGLLTHYVTKTTETMESIAATAQQNADTQKLTSDTHVKCSERLKNIEQTQGRIEMMHYDPHSSFATTSLIRCFLHGCDVLETISSKLEISEKTEPLLKVMKKELKDHERATRKEPVER